jgi:hypothetical protein
MQRKQTGVVYPLQDYSPAYTLDLELNIGNLIERTFPVQPSAVADPSKDGSTLSEWLGSAESSEGNVFVLYSPATEGFVYSVNRATDTAWLIGFITREDAEIKADTLDLHDGVNFPWVEVVEISHDRARQICIDVPMTPQMKSRVMGYRVGCMQQTTRGWRYLKVQERPVSDDWQRAGREPN